MDLAGELIQDLCKYLQVRALRFFCQQMFFFKYLFFSPLMGL